MKLRNKILSAAAALAIGALFYLVFFPNKKKEHIYKPVKVTRGDLSLSLLATGTVQPQNRLEIKSPVSGRVETVAVREGDRVGRGRILAYLSSTERAALLDAARAQGESNLAEWQELYKATPLIAPLSGTIIARNIEPGQTITQQDVLLVLSDRLIVKADVDETDIADIRKGQPAEIALDAFHESVVSARVNHIAFEAKTVNNVTVYEVDVLPDKVPDFMRSGMTANVTFHTARRQNVLLVPTAAVITDGDTKSVLRGGKNRDRAMTKITTGLSDGKQTEVTAGLEEGEIILVEQLGGKSDDKGSPFMPFGRRKNDKK